MFDSFKNNFSTVQKYLTVSKTMSQHLRNILQFKKNVSTFEKKFTVSKTRY
jgi:hypothetical protein